MGELGQDSMPLMCAVTKHIHAANNQFAHLRRIIVIEVIEQTEIDTTSGAGIGKIMDQRLANARANIKLAPLSVPIVRGTR